MGLLIIMTALLTGMMLGVVVRSPLPDPWQAVIVLGALIGLFTTMILEGYRTRRTR